jgi:hypothetical protein
VWTGEEDKKTMNMHGVGKLVAANGGAGLAAGCVADLHGPRDDDATVTPFG